MKKKMALLLAAALTMTTILTGCGGGNEENADKQSDVTAEDAKEENASGDSVSEGGTVFTVGFDAEYPPYGIWMKTENIPDLTWSLHRQSVIWRAGNW